MEIKEWILKNLFNSIQRLDSHRLNEQWFKKTNNEKYYEEIFNLTNFLSIDSFLKERIYCIMNDLKKPNKCFNEKCNNTTEFISFVYGYTKHCSINCSSGERVRKTSERYIKEYGIKHYAQLESVKNKRKQTCLEKHGVDSIFKTEKSKENIKKFYQDNEKVKQRSKQIKQTCLEKYGVDNVSKAEEVKEKIKRKFIEKYGVENPYQLDNIKEKIKQTCLEKYGNEYPCKIEFFKNKALQTNKQQSLERYGVEGYYTKISQIISLDLYKKIINYEWLLDEHVNQKKTAEQIGHENNCPSNLILRLLKKNKIPIHSWRSSEREKKVHKYISSIIQNEIFKGRRDIISPYELDIYVPEYKLAIEFDGIFWHSFDHLESKKEKRKHLNKTELCEQKDIQLLHIFENEWEDEIKQDIWKSIISNKLGKSNKIYARKCKIVELNDNKIIRKFLNENHLQGFYPSNIKLGLTFNNELVSIMTFGKSRYNKNYQYELTRFCNKKYTNVVGGASKLFTYFIKTYNPESIISYADRRISMGTMYDRLGMKLIRKTMPNYYYFKYHKLHSRIMFQKHKLESKLKIFDSSLSEAQNMFNNGYRRIWDCGNLVYEWKI